MAIESEALFIRDFLYWNLNAHLLIQSMDEIVFGIGSVQAGAGLPAGILRECY